MRILIGGSPSTGSSVFRQVLNRHPEIFCGPETNLFCYRALYQNWKLHRRRLLQRRPLSLVQAEARVIRGVHLEESEIGWTREELARLILDHDTFVAFCDAYFHRPLEKNHKRHWAEKTPANVLQFRPFMRYFDEAFIVHTVRDPYDTVSSLVSRGMTAFEAAAVSLLYTAHGVAARNMPGYLEIRYEDLVGDPQAALEQYILEPLGLTFYGEMLAEGNPEMRGESRMQGWRSDELGRLSGQSVSRFHDESEETRRKIETAIAVVRIRPEYQRCHNLAHNGFRELCFDLQYPYHTIPGVMRTEYLTVLSKECRAARLKTWLDRAFSVSGYPVRIGKEE